MTLRYHSDEPVGDKLLVPSVNPSSRPEIRSDRENPKFVRRFKGYPRRGVNLMKLLCCQAAGPKCCEGCLEHPESIARSPRTLALKRVKTDSFCAEDASECR